MLKVLCLVLGEILYTCVYHILSKEILFLEARHPRLFLIMQAVAI